LKKSPIASWLKIVHEQLRLKLKDMKLISLRRVLNHQLYDLLPNSEAQRELLPSIEIELGDGIKVTMEMTVR